MPLTDIRARQAKPAGKPYKLADGGGLYLEVRPGGSRYWRLKYRFATKERRLAFGVYPEVSLSQAREKRAAARKVLAQGMDPSEEKKAKGREARARRDNSFAALAEAWYTKKSGTWAPSTAAKARFYLDSDLIRALGERPIAEIKRTELVETLARIEKRDAHDVAKKCRGWLSGVFRYALAAGVVEANPATDLDIVAAPMPRRRQLPHLPLGELPDFLRALDGYGGESATVQAIRLLLLTAVRPGELRAARWDEFDLDAALWSIPAERMKMRRPHRVPLPVQAAAILRELQASRVRRELVFPSRDDPRQPMSENTINLAIHRIGYKGRQTGHGFRHLISTALNERSYNRDWIERQLAHGDDNEIRAVYNKAEYLDQRREMMQAWADELDSLARGESKVVAIRAA